MSKILDRFGERLLELKDANRLLTISDFQGLGLSGNAVAEAARHYESLGTVEIIRIHENRRDDSGVDQVFLRVTELGREDLSAEVP